MTPEQTTERRNPVSPKGQAPDVRVWESQDLFGPDRQILIHHESEIYVLRITRNGKLIMNK